MGRRSHLSAWQWLSKLNISSSGDSSLCSCIFWFRSEVAERFRKHCLTSSYCSVYNLYSSPWAEYMLPFNGGTLPQGKEAETGSTHANLWGRTRTESEKDLFQTREVQDLLWGSHHSTVEGPEGALPGSGVSSGRTLLNVTPAHISCWKSSSSVSNFGSKLLLSSFIWLI